MPPEERGVDEPVWVEPKLVAEVDFHGWTHGDRVRQASFQGLREDKSAKEVVREVKATPPATTKAAGAKAQRASVKNAQCRATVGKVTLTHPDRVYWEDAGVTKRDLAEYYSKVWKWMSRMSPAGRSALVRCPEGADGQCFFQKHARAGIPTEFLHLVPEKGDKIISIDDLDGLHRAGAGRRAGNPYARQHHRPPANAATGWCSTSIPGPAPAGATWSRPRARCASGSSASSSRAF